MKFTCNKEELIKGINIVIKAAYSKYQKSILECIHIKASDNSIIMDAFDMTTAIKNKIYAEVAEDGETAIPARILFEIVNKMPSGEITFERQENQIQISGLNSTANLSEMDAQQFPSFPELSDNTNVITIDQSTFKKMIDKTSFSAYVGEDRPIFTGLLFETFPETNTICMVGIDGIRMAKYTVSCSCPEKIKAIIPSKMLKEAARIFDQEEEQITLYFNESSCFIMNENIQVFTRLLDGDFINYSSIIPKGYKTKAKVDVSVIKQSLDLMMVLAREDSSNLIKMIADSNQLELQSISEYGNAKNTVPAIIDGEYLKIAFNAKYLIDIFKVIEDSEVYMEFNGRLQACVIKSVNDDNYIYLVVPVNVSD